MLASASKDTTIRVWDVGQKKCIDTLEGHSEAVTCIAFGANSKLIVSGSEDKSLRVWRLSDGQCEKVLIGHLKEITCVSFAVGRSIIASGSADNTFRIWNLERGDAIQIIKYNSVIRDIKFSPNENTLAVASRTNGVTCYSFSDNIHRFVLKKASRNLAKLRSNNVEYSSQQRGDARPLSIEILNDIPNHDNLIHQNQGFLL